MKIKSTFLSVSLNLIAFALAAPTTKSSQETGFSVDRTAYPLKARDIVGGLQDGLSAIVGNVPIAALGNTSPPDGGAFGSATASTDDGALGSGMSSLDAGDIYSGPGSVFGDPAESIGYTGVTVAAPFDYGDYPPFK